MEIHDSARKLGVADHDIVHAIGYALAMPMRDKYERLLEP